MFMWTDISSKAKAAKGSEVRVRGDLIEKELIRRLILQERSRKSIDQIDSYEDAISPENKRNVGLNLQGPSSCKNVLMFPLHNRILLWSVDTALLMNDAIRVVKINHVKLQSIISSNGLNWGLKLSMYHIVK